MDSYVRTIMVALSVNSKVSFPCMIRVTLGVMLSGCADVAEVREHESQQVAVLVDVIQSSGSHRAGRYNLDSNGTEKSLEYAGIGADVSIGAKLIERRKANLTLSVGGESQEFVVTPEWNTVDLLSKNAKLRFRFLSSSIAPFAPTSTLSKQLTVYSLIANRPSVNEPEKYRGIFHENLVRLKIETQDQVISQQLFSVLTSGKATGVQGADCHEPQYGIIAVIDNVEVEMLLDFECAWIYIFEDNVTFEYGLGGTIARTLRDALDVLVGLGR